MSVLSYCNANDVFLSSFEVIVLDLSAAVCVQRCLNGGRCVLPDHCFCRRGYTGFTCAGKVSRNDGTTTGNKFSAGGGPNLL